MKKLEKIIIHNVTIIACFVFSIVGPFINMDRTDNVMTVASFFLLFLIVKLQDRQEKAILLKLDALIKVSPANNQLIKIEEKDEEELVKKSDELSHE